jgi:ATP-dependent protease HslVU (ClpYQ) peptidase subunit
LGCLINKEDVDLLVEKKVIVNWLGSNAEVMTLINKLGHEIMKLNPVTMISLSNLLITVETPGTVTWHH